MLYAVLHLHAEVISPGFIELASHVQFGARILKIQFYGHLILLKRAYTVMVHIHSRMELWMCMALYVSE